MIHLLPLSVAATQTGRTVAALRLAAVGGQVPRLYLGRALRVATAPLPTGQAELVKLLERTVYTIPDLAQAWAIHPDTLQRLARGRTLPMTLRPGGWTISRSRLAQYLQENLWPL